MDKKTAISTLRSDWEKKIGAASEFERSLTPEGRVFKRYLEAVPGVMTETLLNGISIKMTESEAAPLPRGGSEQTKTFLPAFCAGVAVVAAGVVCSLCQCSATLTTVITTAAVVSSVIAAGSRRSRRGEITPPRQPRCPAELEIDGAALEKAQDSFLEVLKNLIDYVHHQEKDSALGFDVTTSKSFAEWVQDFVDYSNQQKADSELTALKIALAAQLRIMGIEVYDSLKKDKTTGELQLPQRTWYRDGRSDDNAEFATVKHAVVSSRRGVLAIGELQ